MSNAPNSLESLVLPDSFQKITFYQDEGDKNCAYFKIDKEDHTLGHLLYSKLLLEKNVIYTGYKRPHPLEHFIFLKIITNGTISPKLSLDYALKDLYVDFSFIENFL